MMKSIVKFLKNLFNSEPIQIEPGSIWIAVYDCGNPFEKTLVQVEEIRGDWLSYRTYLTNKKSKGTIRYSQIIFFRTIYKPYKPQK